MVPRPGSADAGRVRIAELVAPQARPVGNRLASAHAQPRLHSRSDLMFLYFDKMSMATSLEVRVPFADHDVVSFCYGLPDARPFSGSARRSAAAREPRTARRRDHRQDRSRASFTPGLGAWLTHHRDDLVRETLLDGQALERGMYNRSTVLDLVERAQARRQEGQPAAVLAAGAGALDAHVRRRRRPRGPARALCAPPPSPYAESPHPHPRPERAAPPGPARLEPVRARSTRAGYDVTVVCPQRRPPRPSGALRAAGGRGQSTATGRAPARRLLVAYWPEYSRVRVLAHRQGGAAPGRASARSTWCTRAARRTSCCWRCSSLAPPRCPLHLRPPRPDARAVPDPFRWAGCCIGRAACRAGRFSLRRLVLSVNDSYRRVAIERGGRDPDDVVRGPHRPRPDAFTPTEPDPALKRGKRFLLSYVGVMGAQDGVDHALRALAELHGARRLARGVHGRRRGPRGDARAGAPSSGWPTTSSSPAGSSTTRSARCSPAPTCASRRTRRTRSTTSPRW